MTQSVSDFEQQLGRELEAAARRRVESRPERVASQRRRRVGLAVAAAALVAVAALAVFAFLRPDAAVADPFRVVYLADEVHLEIVDLVLDPSAAERDLRSELGVAVELVALPAPPELVGHVVGAASTGTVTAYVVYGDAGRSERIVLPQQIDGTLIVQYGRRAEAGERYEVNVTSPVCDELWGMPPPPGSESPR